MAIRSRLRSSIPDFNLKPLSHAGPRSAGILAVRTSARLGIRDPSGHFGAEGHGENFVGPDLDLCRLGATESKVGARSVSTHGEQDRAVFLPDDAAIFDADELADQGFEVHFGNVAAWFKRSASGWAKAE